MADIDTSLYMMSIQVDWPRGDMLPMKKPHAEPGPPPTFGHMKKDGCTPCRIYDDDGKVLAEYKNAFEAVKDGWRVD